jgi:hypothetical protein
VAYSRTAAVIRAAVKRPRQQARWLTLALGVSILLTASSPTNARSRRLQDIIQALDLGPETPFFPTSAAKKTGRSDMIAWVEALLEANPDEG